LDLVAGDTATAITVNAGGVVSVVDATTNNTTLNFGGAEVVFIGTASGTVVNDGAGLTLWYSDGGTAVGTIVNGGKFPRRLRGHGL